MCALFLKGLFGIRNFIFMLLSAWKWQYKYYNIYNDSHYKYTPVWLKIAYDQQIILFLFFLSSSSIKKKNEAFKILKIANEASKHLTAISM